MIRTALRIFLRALLRVFFRRIELAGEGNLPADGPVVLVANHPSSLVDPVLLLAFAPRPVAFLTRPTSGMLTVGSLARSPERLRRERAALRAELFAAAEALPEEGWTPGARGGTLGP